MIKILSAATTVRRVSLIMLIAILFTAFIPITTYATTTLTYPYQLVPGDPRLDFPAAEGRQLDMQSDTWFMEGFLKGTVSGRNFSFIAVYNINHIPMPPDYTSTYDFDFYSIALYDLDTGDYGTHTTYSYAPYFPLTASTGYLDLHQTLYDVGYQEAVWTTAKDNNGNLVPFTYNVNFPGVDQTGRYMCLTANVQALNPPVAVGADTYNGKITILGQENTYSYFQTGLKFEGTLTWGGLTENVTGTLGHIDRQMFPLYAGVFSGPDGRDISHEWGTYFLNNGVDFSNWRQFDRVNGDAISWYNGATVVDPKTGASYVNDIVCENLSYIRVEMANSPVQPLRPPRAPVLYFPDRQRITSESLRLYLWTEPLTVGLPLLAFPVEYVHGPVLLTGMLKGKHIEGIGSFERTLGLYRDFELVKVLKDSVKHLPAEAFQQPRAASLLRILLIISQVESKINNGDDASALSLANGALRTAIETKLVEPYRSQMQQINNDLINVIGVY